MSLFQVKLSNESFIKTSNAPFNSKEDMEVVIMVFWSTLCYWQLHNLHVDLLLLTITSTNNCNVAVFIVTECDLRFSQPSDDLMMLTAVDLLVHCIHAHEDTFKRKGFFGPNNSYFLDMFLLPSLNSIIILHGPVLNLNFFVWNCIMLVMF